LSQIAKPIKTTTVAISLARPLLLTISRHRRQFPFALNPIRSMRPMSDQRKSRNRASSPMISPDSTGFTNGSCADV
jgi:hypothetical protein